MSFSLFRGWLAAVALVAANAVSAQPAVPGATPSPAAAGAQAADTWRSAFDGYQPFVDAPVTSWRESNDTVGRIGGWRAYAQEAAKSAAPAAAAPVDPGRAPAGSPASTGPAVHRH